MSIKIPAGFSLIEGERPIWYGRMSWKANWFLILPGLLLLAVGIGVILLIIAALRVISTEYFITNKRTYIKYGIISRYTFDLKNEWITNYTVYQGFIGRLLGFGDILVSTPGYYTGTVMMKGVSNPMHLKVILEGALQKMKKSREIEETLRKIEMEYEMGRLPKKKYEELKKKYEEELRKL